MTKTIVKPTDANIVHYKLHQGRGRPSLGKIISEKIDCVEIENRYNTKVFIPIAEKDKILRTESDNSVQYKLHQGRGRPAKGKLIHHNIVCLEIENLNSHRKIYIPVNEREKIKFLKSA